MSQPPSTKPTTSIDFVHGAILKSADGGNTYNVEIEDLIREAGPSERVSLYEQLSKTLAARRAQKVEGNPDELTAEDQEFVNNVLKQKDKEDQVVEEEINEFKRQKLLKAKEQQIKKTINNNDNKNEEEEEEDDALTSLIVVKKKKKKSTVNT